MIMWTVSWFCRQIYFYVTPDRQSAKQSLESGYPPQASGSSETIATGADGEIFLLTEHNKILSIPRMPEIVCVGNSGSGMRVYWVKQCSTQPA
jgi:hypothetical protein